jgi:hypothetical protein
MRLPLEPRSIGVLCSSRSACSSRDTCSRRSRSQLRARFRTAVQRYPTGSPTHRFARLTPTVRKVSCARSSASAGDVSRWNNERRSNGARGTAARGERGSPPLPTRTRARADLLTRRPLPHAKGQPSLTTRPRALDAGFQLHASMIGIRSAGVKMNGLAALGTGIRLSPFSHGTSESQGGRRGRALDQQSRGHGARPSPRTRRVNGLISGNDGDLGTVMVPSAPPHRARRTAWLSRKLGAQGFIFWAQS